MPRSGPTISHAYLGCGSSHSLPRLCRPSSMTCTAFLAWIAEEGPIPAIHGVVRC